MAPVFTKLNLKNHAEILILNAPTSFEKEVSSLSGVKVYRELNAVKSACFVLAFVTQRSELERLSKTLVEKAVGDAVLWFAYPKGTSKKYSCDFNRDDGWDLLRQSGFDTVRQVAIDADWTALRFRLLEFISSR